MKDRHLEMILYLNNKKKSNISELSELFEVSRRTVLRDLDAISTLGVPIYTRSGYGGGVYMDPDYKFDRSFFTPQELENLVMALHIAGELNHGKEKNSLLKKLELILPQVTAELEYNFSEYLKVEPLNYKFDRNETIVQNINRALNEEKWISIISKNEKSLIAPLYYILGSGEISLCGTDGTQRVIFEIHQITSCIVEELKFEREEFIKNIQLSDRR